jgi:hypothetical protein
MVLALDGDCTDTRRIGSRALIGTNGIHTRYFGARCGCAVIPWFALETANLWQGIRWIALEFAAGRNGKIIQTKPILGGYNRR